MRVAFCYFQSDSQWLGGRNYFSSLFSAIQAVAAQDVQIVLVMGQETVTTLPEQFPSIEVVRTALLDRRHPEWIWRQLRRLPSQWSRDPVMAGFLRRHRIDVLSHSGGLGQGAGVKSVGWLPDFQFMQYPEYWAPRELKGTVRLYRSTCKSSDALIVSSRSALADLNLFAPWCDLPKHVLHFLPLALRLDGLREVDGLLAQYRLPRPYFHLPNQFWAHKNHELVVDALALLKQQGVEATVVCTGQTLDTRRPQHFDGLMERCRQAGVVDNFRVLGLVPYADMQSLMWHARAVINPSRFEGWSTTVEEAKAMGKDILLSDLPVHREQAPDSSGFFATGDAKTLAALMRERLATPAPVSDASQVEARHAGRLLVFGQQYMNILRCL